MENSSTRYEGLWIPKFILEDPDLENHPHAKMIWALIHNLSKRPKGCTASNSYIANKLGMSVSNMRKSLTLLYAKCKVFQTSYNGRIRTLNSLRQSDKQKFEQSDCPDLSSLPKGFPPHPPNKDIERKDERRETPVFLFLQDFFFKKMKEIKPNALVKQRSKRSESSLSRLLKVRSQEEIQHAIIFALKDDFWRTVITSLEKLEKHLDAIELKMTQKPQKIEILEENRKILEILIRSYPEDKYNVRYGRDSIEFIGGTRSFFVSCSEVDFLAKIDPHLKNRKMEFRNERGNHQKVA